MELYYCFDIKGKYNFKLFYNKHIVELPINKGANPYKLIISIIGSCMTYQPSRTHRIRFLIHCSQM